MTKSSGTTEKVNIIEIPENILNIGLDNSSDLSEDFLLMKT